MGKNIVEKIFEEHLIDGTLVPGEPVKLRVDEVYTQDATGTMAWLQFEAIGVDRVKVPLAVSYVDHNMIQSNHLNPDDHKFLQTAALRYGAYFSKPGSGICHQVNLERFARPGWIGLGTDSHTPTNGGIGMIAIGVGGLEAATVMAGLPFEIKMPQVVQVRLTGKLQRPWVTAMDVILELLRRLTVKGGVGKIFEYGGPGVEDLSVPERATITNMGAELGATTSVFPSDERTRAFLRAQGRQDHWRPIQADPDASYAEVIEIDLSSLEPLVARPHSPDNVVPVRELEGLKVDQVCIGSCTNSSYQALRAVASVLKGQKVAPHVSMLLNPGSNQVLQMLAKDGSLAEMVRAGVRLLEASCGPCIGMGGAPGTGQVSVRSYNRNFRGRCGNKEAGVYLASPMTCVVAAIKGVFVDPRRSGLQAEVVQEPEEFPQETALVVPPVQTEDAEVVKGPNISGVPLREPIGDTLEAEVLLVTGDNITTDDIMPAGAKILPLRSNIPAISEYVFHYLDPEFASRAKAKGGGIIVGGENYGQGSSREHAALAPMYLGIKAVLAVSFARIHRSNLINFGILPLVFESPEDREKISQGDVLRIDNIRETIMANGVFTIKNITQGYEFTARGDFSERERELLLAGGLLPYARTRANIS